MWSGGLTWRSQVGANSIPIPYPTNLALFGHKITLYRFNQRAHTIVGCSNRSRGLSSPWPPHFNHWCSFMCVSYTCMHDNCGQIGTTFSGFIYYGVRTKMASFWACAGMMMMVWWWWWWWWWSYLSKCRIVRNSRLQKLQMSVASSSSRDSASPSTRRQGRGFASRDGEVPPETSWSTSSTSGYVCCECVTSRSDHAHCTVWRSPLHDLIIYWSCPFNNSLIIRNEIRQNLRLAICWTFYWTVK